MLAQWKLPNELKSPLPEEWEPCFHLWPTDPQWVEAPDHQWLLLGEGLHTCHDDDYDEGDDEKADDDDGDDR